MRPFLMASTVMCNIIISKYTLKAKYPSIYSYITDLAKLLPYNLFLRPLNIFVLGNYQKLPFFLSENDHKSKNWQKKISCSVEISPLRPSIKNDFQIGPASKKVWPPLVLYITKHRTLNLPIYIPILDFR